MGQNETMNTKELCLSEAIEIIKAYAGGSTPRNDLATQLEEVYEKLLELKGLAKDTTKWN